MFLSHHAHDDMLYVYGELKATIQIPNVRLNLSLFTSHLLYTSYLHNDGGIYFVANKNLLSLTTELQ